MTHDDLVEIGRRWLTKPWRNADGGHGGCALVLTEIVTGSWETPDVIGWHGPNSILLEAKASRSDFRKDRKKYFRCHPEMGLGRQRYYIAPKGLIKIDELPSGWGLIEVSERGGTKVVRNSELFESHAGGEIQILLSLFRRLRIDPGRHVNIRGYVMDKDSEPRATFTKVEGDTISEG